MNAFLWETVTTAFSILFVSIGDDDDAVAHIGTKQTIGGDAELSNHPQQCQKDPELFCLVKGKDNPTPV